MPSKHINALDEMAKVLRDTPSRLPVIHSATETCFCGKRVPISNLRITNTGVFMAISDVCKDCKHAEREDKLLARIVCAKCRRVVGRVTPLKDPQGFVFEANKTYHVTGCGMCSNLPENTQLKVQIVEKLIYDNSIGRKYGTILPKESPNKDIIK